MQDILGGENLIFPYGYYAGYGIGFGAPYLLPTYIGDCSFDCSAADFSAGQAEADFHHIAWRRPILGSSPC